MTATDNTIPLAEAARRLQTTPLNLLMHIKRGLIKATETDDGWQIDVVSLDNFIAAHGGEKAPEICASGCSKAHGCGGGCG